MPKISIKQKIAEATRIVLTFISMTVTKTAGTASEPPQNIYTFELEDSMDVRGSQEVDIEGVPTRVRNRNATEVSILENDLYQHEDSFSWDTDSDTGTYEGTELVLDVAKSNGAVWLKPTTFAVSGRQFGAQQRGGNFKKLFGGGNAPVKAVKAGEQLVDTNK